MLLASGMMTVHHTAHVAFLRAFLQSHIFLSSRTCRRQDNYADDRNDSAGSESKIRVSDRYGRAVVKYYYRPVPARSVGALVLSRDKIVYPLLQLSVERLQYISCRVYHFSRFLLCQRRVPERLCCVAQLARDPGVAKQGLCFYYQPVSVAQLFFGFCGVYFGLFGGCHVVLYGSQRRPCVRHCVLCIYNIIYARVRLR